jgi:hypothetical protein
MQDKSSITGYIPSPTKFILKNLKWNPLESASVANIW